MALAVGTRIRVMPGVFSDDGDTDLSGTCGEIAQFIPSKKHEILYFVYTDEAIQNGGEPVLFYPDEIEVIV